MARIITIHDDDGEVMTRVVIEPSSNGTPARVTSIRVDALPGGAIRAEDLLPLESFSLLQLLPPAITAMQQPAGLTPPLSQSHGPRPHDDEDHDHDALPETPAEEEPTRSAGEPGAAADADTIGAGSADPDAPGSPTTTPHLDPPGALRLAEPVSPAAPFLVPEPAEAEEPATAQGVAKVTPATVFNERAKKAVAAAQDAANGGRKHRSAPSDGELSATYKRFGNSPSAVAQHYDVPAYIASNWLTAARRRGAIPASTYRRAGKG